MRHIKVFENFTLPDNDILYYKIEVKKSMDRFNVALDKIGMKKLFYEDWNSTDEFFTEMIKINNFIYLIVDSEGGYDFKLEDKFSDLKLHYNFDDFQFGGEITVEDYEVDAVRYNL